METGSGDERLFSTKDAAKYLEVSQSFLAKARMTGSPQIPFVRIGSAIRYRKKDLDAFITSNIKTSTSQYEGNLQH